MSGEILDRQIWNMLHGVQAPLAQHFGQAVRIDPRYGPFAATLDASERSLSDLGELVSESDGEVWLVEPQLYPAPKGTRLKRTAPLVQMAVPPETEIEPDRDPELLRLTDSDVEEMRAIAWATQPGPWGELTHQYGPFFGLRRNGKLAAMAGERMRPSPEYAEVSGVCTWPEFRGQGLAKRLINRIIQSHRERGLISYLHSYSGNAAAIGLYESLGFVIRREMFVTVLVKD